MKLTDQQRAELETIIADFPKIASKQRSLQKIVESLNPNELLEKLKESSSGKIGKADMQEFDEKIKAIDAKIAGFSSQLKKVSH